MNKNEWINNLKKVLKKADITNIKSIAVFQEAFCHKSYAHEHKLKYNNQRLEFLGDAAIGWVITNYLFSLNPKIKEGDMTIIKSKLVCTETLAKAAKDFGLEKLLFLGKGITEAKITNNMLEDFFEAFIGAVAQDQGIKKVIKIIDLTLVKYHKENLVQCDKDYKTKFQELIQSTSGSTDLKIEYIHDEEKGMKVSKLKIMNEIYGIGKASNYKEADQNAAKDALEKMVNLKEGQ